MCDHIVIACSCDHSEEESLGVSGQFPERDGVGVTPTCHAPRHANLAKGSLTRAAVGTYCALHVDDHVASHLVNNPIPIIPVHLSE